MITSGLVLIACRRAFGDLGAEIEHHDAVGQIHHKSHVVLHQQHRHAAVAQLPQQRGELLLFHVPQSGGGLVEQQQHRIDAQRARDLDDALLAERQAAGQLIDLVGEADALDLARRFRQQFGLIGAVEPEHAGDRAGMAAQMRADRDVFQHGHVRHQLDVLEGAGDAELRHFLRRRVVDVLAEHGDRAAG